MKWGRKKSSSSSSIAHFFPLSWLSKFKHLGVGSQGRPADTKMKSKESSEALGLAKRARWKEGRFHGSDDDSYWRLSFREERLEGGLSRGSGDCGLKTVCYGSDDEEFGLTKRDKNQKPCKMGSDLRKVRALPKNSKPRTKGVRHQKWRKLSGRAKADKLAKTLGNSGKPERCCVAFGEKDLTMTPAKREDYKEPPALVEGACTLVPLNLNQTNVFSEEELDSKGMKFKEMHLKTEKQRKSVHISRELPRRRTAKHSSKVRAYSPRTSAKIECKIKAFEDMRKTKNKLKTKMANQAEEEDKTAFDSFAVVKSSFDPQQDFKNSMLEMIIERGITRPEELEELLACYLTLNCDEYHDLIIQVFRQVWFELKHLDHCTKLQTEQCVNDPQMFV